MPAGSGYRLALQLHTPNKPNGDPPAKTDRRSRHKEKYRMNLTVNAHVKATDKGPRPFVADNGMAWIEVGDGLIIFPPREDPVMWLALLSAAAEELAEQVELAAEVAR